MRLVTIEESNERFASSSEQAREIQEISNKISELMDSFVKERELKHLSQRDLASLLNWKQPALARMERLEVIPRLDTFLKAVMKIGGNVYIDYFNDTIPSEYIKSSQYNPFIVESNEEYSSYANTSINQGLGVA